MTEASKRLVFFEAWADPVGETIMARDPSIDVQRLRFADPAAQNWQALTAAHVYHVRSSRDELADQFAVDAAFLARCPNLLAVSTMGAGYDTVDVATCSRAGVIVVNQSGGNAEAVAEHALGMMLTLAKRIGESDRAIRARAGVERQDFIGHNIEGKTVGIVGLGNIGRRVAELCGSLFKMRVIAHDPYISDRDFAERGASRVPFEELLAAADFVTVHCPRTEETENMLDAEAFGRMKSGAVFINTARGGIHDEAALFAGLDSGHLYGAGVDVWAVEPPAPDHPLLSLDNVLASPHTAGISHESRYRIAQFAGEQLLDIFAGRRPPRLINPEVWPIFVERYEATFGNQGKS
ncbi:MAG: hydroxyacid dehydrogenase [Alphaproteobacteria bacterium]|jgi:D-3-phosphoglycerate dehydrogenase|nr:hydroxyacid dehydrogenase [Alphaproteobacteria bacterium]MDP6567993.1 hydroxyacid dehydrogenase [Alphaproteobacteria bacterium]MDP6813871.1 hydroxyacid dehydrogenase [Alphaproteobacteria bacterium]